MLLPENRLSTENIREYFVEDYDEENEVHVIGMVSRRSTTGL